MSALEHWAADEFRSVNGQLEYIITDALRKAGRLPKNSKENNGQDPPPPAVPE